MLRKAVKIERSKDREEGRAARIQELLKRKDQDGLTHKTAYVLNYYSDVLHLCLALQLEMLASAFELHDDRFFVHWTVRQRNGVSSVLYFDITNDEAVQSIVQSGDDTLIKKFFAVTTREGSRFAEKIQPMEKKERKQVLQACCAQCKKVEPKMTLCGGCQTVYYCSPQCQKDHRAVHKPTCDVSAVKENENGN